MAYGEMFMYGITVFTAVGILVFAVVMEIGEVWRDYGKEKEGAKVAAKAM